jgi:hypothetical protein
VEPVIADSARRHGITNESILHAYRHPIREHVSDQDDGFFMNIGTDHAGRPIEVGIRVALDGTPVIVHAMPARAKFLR